MSVTFSGLPSNIASLFMPLSSSSQRGDASSITSILSAAYSGTIGVTAGASTENPVTALQVAENNQARDVKAEAQQPAAERDIAAFTKAVTKATSVKQLLSNPTVMTILLTANGLGSEVDYPALAQKALMSDPADPNSLANQLSSSNSEWLSTAQAYQFATKGLAVIQDPKAISTITNGYAEVLWRQSLDAQTPGLSNAIYFIQNAKSFTSAEQVLGDSVMRSVVTTALGIPPQLAYQSLTTQEQAITSKLSIDSLQSPQFVQSFADRYLAVMQSTAQAGTTGTSNLSSLAVRAQSLIA